jgi:hypothetical protein
MILAKNIEGGKKKRKDKGKNPQKKKKTLAIRRKNIE